MAKAQLNLMRALDGVVPARIPDQEEGSISNADTHGGDDQVDQILTQLDNVSCPPGASMVFDEMSMQVFLARYGVFDLIIGEEYLNRGEQVGVVPEVEAGPAGADIVMLDQQGAKVVMVLDGCVAVESVEEGGEWNLSLYGVS